jgi:DNA-binding transcriptional MerR regulator
MFRIGEFSRIARVSMRLLRYYEEVGLLRPVRTDPNNGYRYYAAAQLSELNRILVLRDLGLTLEQIGRALAKGVSAQELRGMLLMRRSDIERAMAEQAQALRLIESRMVALEGEGSEVPDDVVIREEPVRRYLSVRGRYTSFAAAVSQALQMVREVPKQLPRGALGTFIGVTHSPEFEPDDIDLELGFELKVDTRTLPRLSGGAELGVSELPAYARVATCVRIGPPDRAHLTTARIGRWLEAGGYRLAGPNREIFVEPPSPERLSESVVEMAFPIEPV